MGHGSIEVAALALAASFSTLAAGCVSGAGATAQGGADVTDLRASTEEVAALPGEPASVSAGGLTRQETPLLTLENASAYDLAPTRRLVVVAGLDGARESARMALDAVRWFKTNASDRDRARWDVSVMPLANPDGNGTGAFPPADGFFNDPERPDTRYVWRWVAYQVPDLVVELRAGPELRVGNTGEAETLTAALADPANGNGLGPVATMLVTAPASDGARAMREVLSRAPERQSPLRGTMARRLSREPLAIARLLAERYPGIPGMAYIPAVAWVHTLRLATLVDDPALSAKVLREVRPWLRGEESLVGERVSFAGVAGTMVFGEIAKSPGEYRETAAGLASEGVALAAAESAPGVPEHGSGWSDDIFLGTIAAVTAGDADGLAAAVRLITRYAGLLQQSSGLWHHSPEAPTAWGRGNGFAARGLAETLTALPADHADFTAVLDIYRRHMDGMRSHQAPDGMWRQVVDLPGSYRETSVTALTVTAMARGVRLGWLDESYRPVIERAWRGILAHVVDDGTLVDVCISTGAGPTLRHYLDRTAVNGADDRGGALVLGAALEMHALAAGDG